MTLIRTETERYDIVSLRTQTYFQLSVVSAEPVTAGNTSAFVGYDIVGFSKVTTKSLASGTGS